MTEPAYPDALPTQHRLHWYVVERVLGQGGFGITYLARDTNLDRPVAIKEYLPTDIATRRPDATIRSRTDELRERYRWGLDRFIKEARTLAQFDHPNIVRVHSVFEANNTAYMVMRFEAGENLSAVLDGRGTLPEEDLLRILLPVLDGLALVHEAGFVHRDIKPDNIHIRADGTPVLLDFGSARASVGKPHTLTILVAPGYAPFEQYYGNSESQGPWTDIYGLGATCYRAIAGRAPLDAISRSKGILGTTRDVMVPASVVGAGRYSGRLLAAIDHALAFGEKDRPQTVAEWRKELIGDGEAPSIARAAERVTQRTETAPAPSGASQHVAQQGPPEPGRGAPSWFAWLVGGVAVLAVVIGVVALQYRGRTGPATPPPAPAAGEGTKALAEKVAALERLLEEQRKQRAEEEQKLAAERAEAARRRQEAERVEAERKQREAERIQAAQKAQDAARAEAARKAQEAARAEAERKRLADEVKRLEAERKREAAANAPPAPPQPVVVPTPAPPTSAQVLANAERAIADRNYAAGLALLKPLAERNNAEAQYRLGNLYLQGQGVSPSDAQALRLFRLAAEQGHARAQLAVGDMYAAGRGVKQSASTAATWYHRAAVQGDSDAQIALADAFVAGRGVPANNFQAYVWYSLAARAGNARGRIGRDKAVELLQPAEIRQADVLVEGWKATAPTASR